MKIIRLELAQHDLDAIFDYIADDNLDAARRFIGLIEEKFILLAASPELGRERSELLDGLRSFPVKRYVIFYRPINGGIEIVRILHGSRDIPNLF